MNNIQIVPNLNRLPDSQTFRPTNTGQSRDPAEGYNKRPKTQVSEARIKTSDLPKRIINKKKLVRRRTLYSQLSKKYFLPSFSSNASTLDNLTRLHMEKYSAIAAFNIAHPKPKTHVELCILHDVLINLFRKVSKRTLFHFDCQGNYRYYVAAIYYLDRSVYERAFKPANDVYRYLSESLMIAQKDRGMDVALPYRETASQIAAMTVNDEYAKKQNYVRVERNKVTKILAKKLRRLWTLARMINKKHTWACEVVENIKKASVKSIVDDKAINKKLMDSVWSIMNEDLPDDILDFAKRRNVRVSEKDPKSFFDKPLNTSTRRQTIGINLQIEESTTRRYFENLRSEPIQRFNNYISMLALRFGCVSDTREVLFQTLEKLPVSMQNIIATHIYAFDADKIASYEFWNTLFSLVALPEGTDSCKDLTVKEVYYMDGYTRIDWFRVCNAIVETSLKKLIGAQRLEQVCEARINISCARYLRLVEGCTLEVNENFYDLYANALPNKLGQFNLYAFLKIAELIALSHLRMHVVLKFSDLDLIVTAVQNSEPLDGKKLTSNHNRSQKFTETIRGHAFVNSVCESTGPMYPTSTALISIQNNKTYLENYVIAVTFAYLYSNMEGNMGVLSHVAYSFLRRTNGSATYVIVLNQLAACYKAANSTTNPENLFNIFSGIKDMKFEYSARNTGKSMFEKYKTHFSGTYQEFNVPAKSGASGVLSAFARLFGRS